MENKANRLFNFLFFGIKSAGIKVGDFIIAIQDQDVRWSKHAQVVDKIRSCSNYVKLTLISSKPLTNETQQTPKITHSTNSIANKNHIDNTKILNNQSSKGKLKSTINLSCKLNANKINNEANTSNNESNTNNTTNEKNFRSLRLPFNTLQIRRKFKRNGFKLNLFSSMKSSNNKIKLNNGNNKNIDENYKKNELMYKTI